MNTAYVDAAVRGVLSELSEATNGDRNNLLFKAAARLYEIVEAGELSDGDADELLWREAQALGLEKREIKETLKSARKRTLGKPAIIPAERQKREPAPTPKAYTDPDDYARDHGTPPTFFRAAGWRGTTHDSRPALAIATATGERYRYLDGQEPRYHSPAGYRRSWYRLDEALALTHTTDQPLTLCNGEASTVAAQYHGVAAFAVAGGSEKPAIPDGLLAELREAWDGAIDIAFDCDKTGREKAPPVAEQLRAAGYRVRVVDLNGGPGFDLADFCRLHGGDAVRALAGLPELSPTDTPTDRSRYSIDSEDALYTMPPLRFLDRELGLVAGAYHLIYGASGSGKTFVAVERAMRQVALGRRVLYIATEDLSGLRYRVAAWRRAYPGSEGKLTWLRMPEGLDLQEYDQVAELIETIAPYEYDHIVLDTLREAHSGDENSSQDTRRINRAIQRLVASGAAVDVIHHSGVAGERPRGSTALFSNADVVLRVEHDDDLVRLSFDKLRAPPRDPLNFGLVQQDSGLTDTDGESVISCVIRPSSQVMSSSTRLKPTQRKVLEVLNLSIFVEVGAKAQQVIDTCEITRRHTFLALAALKNRGYIRQAERGDPYYITEAGRAQLGPELVPARQSDLPFSAPVRPSDPSDLQVISSDPHSTVSEVIHSDHTRRVITVDHSPITTDQTVGNCGHESCRRAGLTRCGRTNTAEDERGEYADIPDPADVIARLKRQQEST